MLRPNSRLLKELSDILTPTSTAVQDEALAALQRNDGKKALELFEELVALDSKVACYCIGDIYLHGQGGIPHNPAEAKKWYEQAFASSVPRLSQYAALKLGYIYGAGYDETNQYGSARDYGKAFYYYKKLEDSNIARGLLQLGVMYEKGLGTPKDPEKAMELYRRATDLGHVIAKKCLASMKVRNGKSVSGYLLWASAIFEAIPLVIFKRHSPRIVTW